MILFVILYNLLFLSLVECSNIGTFKDKTCSKSLDNYNGPNGYPDGTCTPLHLQSQQSFQVVGLDPGCQVTIYGKDDDPSNPCSSNTKIVAEFAQCYNSSWVYYSIDGCDIPSKIPSSSATPESTPKPTSSIFSTSSASSSSSSSSVTPPATSSPAPAAAARPSNHTGVIVGGIVGGVSAFALVFIAALLFLRRRPQATHQQLPPSYELSEDRALRELPYPEKTHNTELYAHERPTEIGRNSQYIPPAELPGDSLVREDKKNVRPLVKMHLV